MIDTYKIKQVGNEEVLYIYLNFNYEIGLIDFNFHKENIKNIIEKFIKNSKITFMGTTVALVIGGVLLGHITLDKNITLMNETTIFNNQIKYDVSEDVNNIDDVDKEISDIENIKEELPVVEQTKENIEEQKTELLKESADIKHKEDNKVSEYKIDTLTIEKNEDEVIDKKIEENIDKNIYVSVIKNNQILNIELEEYVVGVVASEMPASFSLEALKAQAVLARTYALKAINKSITLTSDSKTQNYKTIDELKSMWVGSFDTYFYKVKRAVDDTTGLYLSYNNDFIEAVYHSTSNGYTEDAINVWGNSFPYLVSVESKYDTTNQSFYKEEFISYSDLSVKLKDTITESTDFLILNKTSSGRVLYISINNHEYSGVDIRGKLGLRSTDFEIEKTNLGVIFKTKGYGHGVGMSQYGANGMARAGYNYVDILNHYYQGAKLENI